MWSAINEQQIGNDQHGQHGHAHDFKELIVGVHRLKSMVVRDSAAKVVTSVRKIGENDREKDLNQAGRRSRPVLFR